MTNFEKWKQGLTVEVLVKHLKSYDIEIQCAACPARKFCKKAGDRIHSCADVFNEWAEQKCKEENDG